MHLFFECEEVKKFKQKMNWDWNLNLPNNDRVRVLGLGGNNEEMNKVCTFLILECNYYIQNNNREDKPIDLPGLRSQLHTVETVEYQIAQKNDKMQRHLEKWEAITAQIKSKDMVQSTD